MTWEDSAACQGVDPDKFSFIEKGDPLAEGMTFGQRLALNRNRHAEAEEICIECPVMFTCAETADVDERRWTIRGGLMPTRYIYEVNRYKQQGRPLSTGADRMCQRGHLVPGGGRCATCKNAKAKARYLASREKV